MTHEKFIELLNLYLDGALPPDEASTLEREIHGNLERRRIYRQYCQMQNACAQLSERLLEEASPAAQFRRGAVVEFPRRASGEWFRSLALVASGAAAACAVFVGVRVSVASHPTSAVAQSSPTPAVTTAAAAPLPAPTATNVALTNPSLFSNPWAADQRLTPRMISFNQLAPLDTSLRLTAPELKLPPGIDSLPVGFPPDGTTPRMPLQMEEIEANAFQFPR